MESAASPDEVLIRINGEALVQLRLIMQRGDLGADEAVRRALATEEFFSDPDRVVDRSKLIEFLLSPVRTDAAQGSSG